MPIPTLGETIGMLKYLDSLKDPGPTAGERWRTQQRNMERRLGMQLIEAKAENLRMSTGALQERLTNQTAKWAKDLEDPYLRQYAQTRFRGTTLDPIKRARADYIRNNPKPRPNDVVLEDDPIAYIKNIAKHSDWEWGMKDYLYRKQAGPQPPPRPNHFELGDGRIGLRLKSGEILYYQEGDKLLSEAGAKYDQSLNVVKSQGNRVMTLEQIITVDGKKQIVRSWWDPLNNVHEHDIEDIGRAGTSGGSSSSSSSLPTDLQKMLTTVVLGDEAKEDTKLKTEYGLFQEMRDLSKSVGAEAAANLVLRGAGYDGYYYKVMKPQMVEDNLLWFDKKFPSNDFGTIVPIEGNKFSYPTSDGKAVDVFINSLGEVRDGVGKVQWNSPEEARNYIGERSLAELTGKNLPKVGKSEVAEMPEPTRPMRLDDLDHMVGEFLFSRGKQADPKNIEAAVKRHFNYDPKRGIVDFDMDNLEKVLKEFKAFDQSVAQFIHDYLDPMRTVEWAWDKVRGTKIPGMVVPKENR